MDRKMFRQLVEDFDGRAMTVLFGKNDHYAYPDNAFYNFEIQGVICDCSPVEAMWQCMAKHLAGTRRLLNKLEDPDISVVDHNNTLANIRHEKLVDIANYCKLIDAYLGMMTSSQSAKQEPPDVPSGDLPWLKLLQDTEEPEEEKI